MAYREFTDSGETDWIAFDVRPRRDDRRANERRSSADTSNSLFDRVDQRDKDRRLTVSIKGAVRLILGWLCFESPGERRRLQPIPSNWDRLPDDALERLLDSAQIVPVRAAVAHAAKPRR